MSDQQARIQAANEALKSFAPETTIERRPGGWYVCWTSYRNKKPVARRWSSSGQSFYPPWHHQWHHGGTATTALANLIRWCRGQPVLGIGSWRYWAGPGVLLLRQGDAEQAIATLLAAGYPEHHVCVLCGQQIEGSLDWWHFDKVSGPCCGWTTGCRQKVTP
jgi:hypothetical protein